MDAFPINGLDATVGIAILVSGVLAFLRGFIHEILSVVAWIGAVLAALYGSPYARSIVRDIIPINWLADLVTAVVIFLLVLVLLSVITRIMAKSVQASALNNLDRSLGFVYGLARAAVIIAVGMMTFDWFVAKQDRPEWMQSSKSLPLMEFGSELVRNLLPETFMAADDTAKNASEMAKDALEVQRTLEKLTLPRPGPALKGSGDQDGAYGKDEREDMDRLFQSNQDQQ